MAVDTFFDKASDKSIVKTRIVHEYFGAWFNVLKHKARSAGSPTSTCIVAQASTAMALSLHRY